MFVDSQSSFGGLPDGKFVTEIDFVCGRFLDVEESDRGARSRH